MYVGYELNIPLNGTKPSVCVTHPLLFVPGLARIGTDDPWNRGIPNYLGGDLFRWPGDYKWFINNFFRHSTTKYLVIV